MLRIYLDSIGSFCFCDTRQTVVLCVIKAVEKVAAKLAKSPSLPRKLRRLKHLTPATQDSVHSGRAESGLLSQLALTVYY